jgi:hypothetical protein
LIAEAGVREVAAALAGSPVDDVRVVRGGGNSRLYRIATRAGAFALKCYPAPETDPRDRLGREFGAFTFLRAHGTTSVPRALAHDRQRGCALYEWIDGAPVQPAPPAIAAMLALMQHLHALRDAPGAAALPRATEAVTALSELHVQIDERYARLLAVADGEPTLRAFLVDELRPERERLRARDGVSPLPRAAQTLSPSDFGTHNMLQRPGGAFAFVDFEYFGWDDPAKLVADVVWHPAMNLERAAAAAFAAGAAALYRTDPDYPQRYATAFPLYGLRWALIVLNAFLPGRWEQRRLAGDGATWAAAKARQLRKAEALLARVRAR